MNISQARKIKIEDYLLRIGLKPERAIMNGKELKYYAYYREDKNPSLYVNTEKNIWMDRSSGIGGDLIDLVKVEKSCDTSDALSHLDLTFKFIKTDYNTSIKLPSKNKKMTIINNQKVTSETLFDYSLSRGISKEVVLEYCREVRYKNRAGTFLALGVQNISGGWDLRAKSFKGKFGKSDISFFDGKSEKLILVEGFFDLLSIAELTKVTNEKFNFLCLNSTVNWDKAIPYFNQHEKIYLAFDNGMSGRQTTKELQKLGENIFDISYKYGSFDDVNEWLLHLKKAIP